MIRGLPPRLARRLCAVKHVPQFVFGPFQNALLPFRKRFAGPIVVAGSLTPRALTSATSPRIIDDG
jgi:hypothetical protein